MDLILSIFRRYSWILVEILYTLFILAWAWLLVKVLDRTLRRYVRAPSATDSHLKNYIAQALRLPIIYFIFLIAVYTALHRLPLPARVYPYSDGVLFVLGVVIVVSLLLRVFSALLRWYSDGVRANAGAYLQLEFLPLIDKVLTVLVLLIGIVTILDHFRIDIKSLLVTLGVGSLAIGLALQDTLANIFGGFTIMLDRPFRIGDFIELAGGGSGYVIAIGIRSTQIRTNDNNVLSIPNSLLVKNMITNHSYPDNRLVLQVKLTVARGTDMAQARQHILQAVLSVEEVLREPAPEVFFTEFTDSGLGLLVVASITDYRRRLNLLDKVNQHIYAQLQLAKISLASPARVIYMKTDTTEGGRAVS